MLTNIELLFHQFQSVINLPFEEQQIYYDRLKAIWFSVGKREITKEQKLNQHNNSSIEFVVIGDNKYIEKDGLIWSGGGFGWVTPEFEKERKAKVSKALHRFNFPTASPAAKIRNNLKNVDEAVLAKLLAVLE